MKKVYFLIIFCAFFLPTYSQNSVSGTIFDSSTGETLIGANIVLVNTNITTDKIGSATDLNGEFRFNNLQESNYEITVSYIGYTATTLPITFLPQGGGSDINLSINLDPDIVLNVVNLIGDQEIIYTH